MTWVFAFMVMLPTPSTALYLNFLFALIFCILNICFGFALQASSIVFKITSRPATKPSNGIRRAVSNVAFRQPSAYPNRESSAFHPQPVNRAPSVVIEKTIAHLNDDSRRSKPVRERNDNKLQEETHRVKSSDLVRMAKVDY